MIKDEIQNWAPIITANSTNDKILESAFLNVAIACEKYLSEKFIHFATDPSAPTSAYRNISIASRDDFSKLIRGESTFADYGKAIDRCSSIIFTKDPFRLMPSGSFDVINEVKAIRNYLAHKSDEARNKYVRVALTGGAYISVADHLRKKRSRNPDTNYERMAKTLIAIEEMFEDSGFSALVARI